MMDLPWASLEENSDIVKPISTFGLTTGFAEEALTGHGISCESPDIKVQNQCRLRRKSRRKSLEKVGPQRGSSLAVVLS
jgi:hypothetical protein